MTLKAPFLVCNSAGQPDRQTSTNSQKKTASFAPVQNCHCLNVTTAATKTIRRNGVKNKAIKHPSTCADLQNQKLKIAHTQKYDTRQMKFINVGVHANRTQYAS